MLAKKPNSASSTKEKTHGKLNTCGRTKISEDLLEVAQIDKRKSCFPDSY